MNIRGYYITNKGNHRQNNQDSLLVDDKIINNVDMDKVQEAVISGNNAVIFVADGMGGYENGEIASRIALETFYEYREQFISKHELQNVILEAKARLVSEAEKQRSSECGTTVSGIFLKEEKGYVINIGDSRTYKLNGKYLERLTKDHSLVQQLFEMGMISEDDMRFHPEKNIVTSAITNDNIDEVPLNYYKVISLKKDDVFLFCTDGIWESISHDELETCIDRSDLKSSVQKIYDKCMKNGGNDNLTIIIILVENIL